MNVTLPKEEYDKLKQKADWFDHYIEELTPKELARIKKAMKGPFMSEEEFLRKHPEFG